MKNVSEISHCYGCGVCAASCPKHIISLTLDKDGYYEAAIADQSKCVECGICLDVCAFNHKTCANQSQDEGAWAAWSNNAKLRKKCTSGGIGFEIGRQLIEKGYKAIGCRYNIETQRAEHFVATTIEEYAQSIGSKYIQSFTEEAFKQIDRKQKYFVTGTPCQIDSLRRLIQKYRCEDNFILLDFFCHSVPSMHVWQAYMKLVEPKVGKITYASWRNKLDFGWHHNCVMGIDGERTSKPVNWNQSIDQLITERKCAHVGRLEDADMFWKMFLGNFIVAPHCQKQCKYKYDNSAADIRIGDLWGKTYKDNEEGVSGVAAFTKRGRDVIKSLEGVTLTEHPFSLIAEGQKKENVKGRILSPLLLLCLRRYRTFTNIPFRCLYNAQRLINVVTKRRKK